MPVSADLLKDAAADAVADLPSSSLRDRSPFPPRSIFGFAIVSTDGMLANAAGVIPDALKVDADRTFFESALDKVDVVVHGRNSHERQPHSFMRKRLILTHQVRDIEPEGATWRAFRWNPRGVSFEQALAVIDAPDARVGVVGATDVFGLFLDRYDAFFLTRGPDVSLPGGRPVFPAVPGVTPEQVLARNGLEIRARTVLDRDRHTVVTQWSRTAPGR